MTLTDTIAACNMIRGQRLKNKKMKIKGIRTDFDNNEKIYTRLNLFLNPSTGTVIMSHCLRYGRLAFYPTTNQRLWCTNRHALNKLHHKRVYDRERYWTKKNTEDINNIIYESNLEIGGT